MQEKNVAKINGFSTIVPMILLVAAEIWFATQLGKNVHPLVLAGSIQLVALICAAWITSLVAVAPNDSIVLTFFGRYVGVIRESGFWCTVPFCKRQRISLKVVNFSSERLKVNDVCGNPIEIAAVVVYRVTDSARAAFDVDDYSKFVAIQSEAALRHVASKYPYDSFEDGDDNTDIATVTLRGSSDVIAQELLAELGQRLTAAGVQIIEARLMHLAYAMEIAGAMLQRQQAQAILSARRIVVEGAVGMAQMAIRKLQADGVVELDDERKMVMINNLMVAIVSEKAAQPIINTGSLY